MTIVWFVGGVVMMVVGAVCAVGAVLPRDHVASGSVVVKAARGEVWRAIRDVGASAGAGGAGRWRKSVKSVVVEEGGKAWVEESSFGKVRMVWDAEKEGEMLQVHIDDAKQPFGGTWTWELSDEGGGTKVVITERGFVKSPPFRFLSKFVFGHETTLKGYLGELAGRFGGAK